MAAKSKMMEYDFFVYPEWCDDSMTVRTSKGLAEAKKIAFKRASSQMKKRKNWDISLNSKEEV